MNLICPLTMDKMVELRSIESHPLFDYCAVDSLKRMRGSEGESEGVTAGG